MKALLHILLIAICGAGVFFSQQANVKFQEQKTTYLKTVDDNKKLDADIKVGEKELSDERTGLKDAEADFNDKQATLETLVSNEKTMQRQLGESEAKLEEQAVVIKSQQELLKQVKEAFKTAVGSEDITLENIGSKIEELEAKKKDQTKKFEEVSTLAGSAEKTVSDNKMKIAELAGRKAKRDERISANAKEAVISAVDTDWGFVIIGAGSNVGFTPQTKLLVKRDGVMIGRITPTSIEPSQTIGEVDRESLAPGVSFQVGDRVILAVPATR
jgi:myosin heavy subunit